MLSNEDDIKNVEIKPAYSVHLKAKEQIQKRYINVALQMVQID